MWGYWRVYNTLQGSTGRMDVMPDLRELPDRYGRMLQGVTSDQLIGKTVDWFGKMFRIIEKGKSDWKATPAVVTLKDWVEMQMPNQGKPGHAEDERGQIVGYDASVHDWAWDANRAMSEKESTIPKPQVHVPGARAASFHAVRTDD